jgi:hypothetical protein
MTLPKEGVQALLVNGIHGAARADERAGPLFDQLSELLDHFGLDHALALYDPDEALRQRLSEYAAWCDGNSVEDAGNLMEELAFLAFQCLQGHNSMKSYWSFSAQHDLVISGGSALWDLLMDYLHLEKSGRSILIEAKNLSETKHSTGKIDDHQFSRVCGILQNKFVSTAHLGVFFSRHSATGFPKHGQTLKHLHDAQATQLIFHALTKKFVVVLDDDDIRRLGEPGALPRLLEAKIREIEAWTGRPIEFTDNWEEVLLPPHLAQHRRRAV